MEDRFKFRQWAEQTKTMLYNIEQTDDVCLMEYLVYGNVMQCTGLRDDNGRLIYEGDIVKFAEHDFHDFAFEGWETEQATVVWGGKYDYPAFDLEGTDFDGTNGLSYLFGSGWHKEVIGNIYENPELLEGC